VKYNNYKFNGVEYLYHVLITNY